jgi:hypothetical protein
MKFAGLLVRPWPVRTAPLRAQTASLNRRFKRELDATAGAERNMARVLARGLRDLARTEAWLEGDRSMLVVSVLKATTLPASEPDFVRPTQLYDFINWVNAEAWHGSVRYLGGNGMK